MPQQSIAYAVARTRAMEVKLINSEKLRRMLEAPDAASVLRTLVELGYGGMQEGNDYEAVISAELTRTYDYIRRVTPNQSATDIFLLKNDCHNIKTLLKGRMLNRPVNDALVNTGTVPVEKMQEAVSLQDYSVLPANMAEVAKTVAQMVESGNADPLEMDCVLDAACYADMAVCAEESGEPLAVALVEAQADLRNLITILRLRKAGVGGGILRTALLPGGSIPVSRYIDAYGVSEEALVRALDMGKYADAVAAGLDEYIRDGSIVLLEKKSDDYITALVSSHKYEAFTIAPIFGYILAKEREAQAIRLVVVAKLNGVPVELVTERLRGLYE